jgi:hypothetical protein
MTAQDFQQLQIAADNGTIKDAVNPVFIFSLTATELLSKIVSGEIDAVEFAKYELANRGLDNTGKWVGFKN